MPVGDHRRQPRSIELRGQHDAAARDEAARDDREPADVRDRHAEQPTVVRLPPEIRGTRGRGGLERIAREHRRTRHPRRPRRVDDRRGVRMRQRSRARGRSVELASLVRGEARMEQQHRRPPFEMRVERDERVDRDRARERRGLAVASWRTERIDALAHKRRERGEREHAAICVERGAVAGFARGSKDRKRSAHPAAQGRRRNLRKSGLRFSRYAFLPSCPSADR